MTQDKCFEVICPFCCHKFYPNDALFRLPRNKLVKAKTKIGKSKSKVQSDDSFLDTIFYEYCINVKQMPASLAKKAAMEFEVVSLSSDGLKYDAEELEKYGFVQSIVYTNGASAIKSDSRICPVCHNLLPKGAGLRPTKLISIIGDSRVGKSIYLTMLINELSNNADFMSRLTFIGDSDSKAKFFNDYENPLINEHVLVNATERKKIPPFAFNYWYQYKAEGGQLKEKSIDLIFYDIAGEDLRDAETLRQNGFNIKDSSGIIYLVDPTNFSRLHDVFLLSDKRLIDSVPKENSSKDIISAMFNYFLGNDNEKSNIPIALVVSKADLFEYLQLPYFQNRPNSRILHTTDDEAHRGYLRNRVINGENVEVRALLKDLGEEQLINNVLANFKNTCCFAVSSLGRLPEYRTEIDEETKKIREVGYVNGELSSFRAKEPFYWILAKNEMMYFKENGNFYNTTEKSTPNTVDSLFTKIIQGIQIVFRF